MISNQIEISILIFVYHILKQGHKYDVMIKNLPESPPGTEGYSDTIYNPVVRTPRMTDNSES